MGMIVNDIILTLIWILLQIQYFRNEKNDIIVPRTFSFLFPWLLLVLEVEYGEGCI